MIRFVDLTESYWTDPMCGSPCCAFLDTVTDTFLAVDGLHVFDDADDIGRLPPDMRDRCLGLVPDGFFDRTGGPVIVCAPEVLRRLLAVVEAATTWADVEWGSDAELEQERRLTAAIAAVDVEALDILRKELEPCGSRDSGRK